MKGRCSVDASVWRHRSAGVAKVSGNIGNGEGIHCANELSAPILLLRLERLYA